jgi:cytochrome c553
MRNWQSARGPRNIIGAGAAAFAASCVVTAAGGSAGRAADVELGRYLASECITCHGVAKATDTIPEIHGMAETTFAEVVKAYREKRLQNQVMQNVAMRLKDEEIAALAAYFATAKKPK